MDHILTDPANIRFYLAGPYGERKRLLEVSRKHYGGFTCTSRWLTGMHDDLDAQTAALDDVADVRAADVLILDADVGSTRGGMWVEMGIAIERSIPILVVSRHDPRWLTVFAHLPGIHHEPNHLHGAAWLENATAWRLDRLLRGAT